MAVIEEWGTALTAQANAGDSTAAELQRLATSSAEYWEGAAADAFLKSVERRLHTLALMIDACRSCASAGVIYADRVKLIKIEADALRSQARAATAVLAGPDSRIAPPAVTRVATEEQRQNQSTFVDATRKISAAEDKLAAADAGLSDLAEARHVADQDFMAVVASAMSGKIETGHSVYRPLSGEEWKRANMATIGFLTRFSLGKEPRDASYVDGGVLARALADSGHVKHVREVIADRLKRGELSSGDGGSWRRELSTDQITLASDALNAVTLGRYGNLAETMVGSYAMNYEIVNLDGERATVTFTAINDTTRESLNRIPGSDLSMPWAPQINFWHDALGGFQPTGETIVWTEIIEVK